MISPPLAARPSATASVLQARPVHWLGRVSYSIYLVHFPLISLFTVLCGGAPAPTNLSAIALAPAGLLMGTVLLLAGKTHRYIEVPGRVCAGKLLGLSQTPLSFRLWPMGELRSERR